PSDVLAATVFRTMDPVREQTALAEWVRARPLPVARDVAFIREHDEFCVLEGKVDFPIFQDGERPYFVEGGRIHFGADGEPVLQWTEEVLFALAVPKGVMPAAGWPLTMFGNGTGGWRFSVMDRGEQSFDPGKGPAKFLGARGIGAVATDPILHWTRSPDGDPTGGWFFNPLNPHAIRDNLRQAAVEFTVVAGLAETLSLDPALCPASDASAGPGGRIVYDPASLFYMSQSQGSTHGPSAVATERRISAAVFSGAGGSAIYTMRYKTDFPVRDLISLAIGTFPELVEVFDPALTLVQTVMDPAEALNFAGPMIREPILGGAPQHALVIEGKGDTYVPNPMDGALAAALGLDLVNPVLIPDHLEELALAGRSVVDAPVSLNNAEGPAPVTAALVQYEPKPGKDGHFVTFTLNGPKHRYPCFLASLVQTGAPVLPPANDDPLAPCE
ncbi:MAG: hypothetical protein K8I02_08250, partial [Candidatus Methylomirabilis sp.]|nr:hypothetical protein [Deltaproteobacteria bacterium]